MTARTAAVLKANFQDTDPQDQMNDIADTIINPQDAWSVTTGTITTLTATTVQAPSGPIDFDSVIKPNAEGGADAANALLIGVGTSANPATDDAANKSFLEFRTQTTATSGDSRGGYFRHELNGAGVSGESLRANTNLGAGIAVNTAHGLHGSIAHQAGSTLTGLGVGVRAGWILPDAAVGAGGTYYGGQSEIYVSGDSSDPSAVTKYAVHDFQIGGSGNAAAQSNVKNFLSFTFGGTDGSGNAIYSHDHDPGNADGSIRILVDGAVKYLKFWGSE